MIILLYLGLDANFAPPGADFLEVGEGGDAVITPPGALVVVVIGDTFAPSLPELGGRAGLAIRAIAVNI